MPTPLEPAVAGLLRCGILRVGVPDGAIREASTWARSLLGLNKVFERGTLWELGIAHGSINELLETLRDHGTVQDLVMEQRDLGSGRRRTLRINAVIETPSDVALLAVQEVDSLIGLPNAWSMGADELLSVLEPALDAAGVAFRLRDVEGKSIHHSTGWNDDVDSETDARDLLESETTTNEGRHLRISVSRTTNPAAAGRAIQRLREERRALRQRLQEESVFDSVTGLLERTAFERRLEQEVERANRYSFPLNMLMLSLSDFESFLTVNGKSAAEQVLRDVASTLRKRLRVSDIICRRSVNEFVALLPHTRMVDAIAIAKDVQELIVEETPSTFTGRSHIALGEQLGFDFPAEFQKRIESALHVARGARPGCIAVHHGNAVELLSRPGESAE